MTVFCVKDGYWKWYWTNLIPFQVTYFSGATNLSRRKFDTSMAGAENQEKGACMWRTIASRKEVLSNFWVFLTKRHHWFDKSGKLTILLKKNKKNNLFLNTTRNWIHHGEITSFHHSQTNKPQNVSIVRRGSQHHIENSTGANFRTVRRTYRSLGGQTSSGFCFCSLP